MTGINPAKRTSKKAIIPLNDRNAAGPDGTHAEAKKADVKYSRFSKHAARNHRAVWEERAGPQKRP